MENNRGSTPAKSRINLYLLVAGMASIPIFLIMQMFVNSIGWPEDEAMSTALTIVVLGGLFTGRTIAAIWTHRDRRVTNMRMIVLNVVALILTFWIFFYAEFPLRDRLAMSILLFALPLFALSIVCGSIIKLVRTLSERQLNEARKLAANSASELQLLQSQISPHFLFNTLNNMYGLSITQHEKIPPLLLKLSDLLRYSVYDASKQFVAIQDEIAYINNYVEFEKMRIGERLALTVEFEDFTGRNIRIAPMLMVVFVENAFKHSKNSTDSVFIHISLKTWENRILFSVVNSYSERERRKEGDEHSGLGLENVKKRLELLYPGEHHLVIEDSDSTYKVMMQIKMK